MTDNPMPEHEQPEASHPPNDTEAKEPANPIDRLNQIEVARQAIKDLESMGKHLEAAGKYGVLFNYLERYPIGEFADDVLKLLHDLEFRANRRNDVTPDNFEGQDHMRGDVHALYSSIRDALSPEEFRSVELGEKR